VTRPAPSISLRHGANALASLAPAPPRPVLVTREALDPEVAGTRRTRLWEFNTNLHCSIIGTCLSTGELRHVVTKLGLANVSATDHELHGTAVSLAARHDAASKRLQKALDQRHRLAINRFGKANSEHGVRALWRDSVKQGDIPGAYWAALTHPATTAALIREAFGEVHMLSHLVGAANRADIRRLSALEQGRTELQARLARQQMQLRDAIVTRDVQLRDLRDALAARIAADQSTAAPMVADETLRQLVADLERRLGAETGRRLAVERRLAGSQARADAARSARAAAEQAAVRLRDELHALEAGLRFADDGADAGSDLCLDGLSVLYVGGRPGDIPRLRAIGERVGASLLHHDGGVEESSDRLAALASRADLVLFPVDCISHSAVLTVKRLCRRASKRYVPLRSSGATSFLAALCRPEVADLACRERQARIA